MAVDEARRRGRSKAIDPSDLADEQEVQNTINMYLDYFSRPDDQSFNIEDLNAGMLWKDSGDGDMGVDEMKKKSTQELCVLLGFQDGRPFMWNGFRSLGNIQSAWDTTNQSELLQFADGGDDMELLTLLWHQLVGVASMASKVWLKDESEKTFGILLADDVGVGKTAQVMAFIALVQLVYESEKRGEPLPPLLSESSPSTTCTLTDTLPRREAILHGSGQGAQCATCYHCPQLAH
jgi:SNF2 family DNA or RNA helicase